MVYKVHAYVQVWDTFTLATIFFTFCEHDRIGLIYNSNIWVPRNNLYEPELIGFHSSCYSSSSFLFSLPFFLAMEFVQFFGADSSEKHTLLLLKQGGRQRCMQGMRYAFKLAFIPLLTTSITIPCKKFPIWSNLWDISYRRRWGWGQLVNISCIVRFQVFCFYNLLSLSLSLVHVSGLGNS